MDPLTILVPLLLLLAANGSPVVARLLLGKRFAAPLDAGLLFFDSRPLFGHAKSWRGLFAAIIMTTLLALLLQLEWWLGAIFGLLAMVGDTLADLLMGRRADVGLKIGVLTGAGDPALLRAHADVVLRSIAEIAIV